MKTAALIVSAGSTKQHPHFDPMRMVGSLSAIQRLIMTFHLAEADPIVLLVPHGDPEGLEKHVAHMGAVFLRSDAPLGQMFDSVSAGLTYLADQCEQVLITPVDVPLFSLETVKALLASGKALAVPRWDGKNGHPLLIGQTLFSSVLEYDGENGLRGAVRACGHPVAAVEVPDPGILIKSEEAQQNTALISAHSLNRWRPVVKVQIAKESTFLGPGCRQLLRLIQVSGSVRLACQQMGMSYSKAWKILNCLEQQLEFPVVVRKKGGKQGGETLLTARGIGLLDRFDRFEQECQAAVNELFAQHFGNDGEGPF